MSKALLREEKIIKNNSSFMSLNVALERIRSAQKNKYIRLDLNGLQLTEIPVEVCKLTHLTHLSLSANQITEIKNLEALTQLTKLDLRYNRLTKIKGLETLTQLNFLDVGDNQVSEIKGLEALSQLNFLYLNSNKITEIKGLEKLTQLIRLYLNSNKITEIKGLEKLTQLVRLNLFNNQIAEIKSLEKLTQLTELILSNNQIAEIKSLEKLTQLTELILSNNQIAEIKSLDNLSQLALLVLENNQITEIKGLEKNRKLNCLYLCNNRITELPENLLELGKSINWGFGYLTTGIYVHDNPFVNPLPEIIKQGDRVIREYFDQRRKSGAEQLNEAKLILLGDSRSGKTSLSNRLLGKNLPKESDRTQGVDIVIGEYSFRLVDGKDFKINIWDFAGQDKYKTLHQLFYTDSSLYVMVAESGNTTVDYDDWFQTASLFGEGSPLILILNEFKAGIGMGSFDTNYWKKQFPDVLKQVFTVNLGTKENFSTAEEYIRLFSQTLPHTKYTFPSNWAAIRRILNERRNEQYITLKEYFEICKSNNLPEKESALILSSILHKVGDCLHYQKSELLKQFIILKNEWATEAVYKILDDRIVAEDKCGFFDLSDLERIWCNLEHADMRPQLLELMKQFKLAYQLSGKDEFVTPPLLRPASPADYSWSNLDSLELYIEYEFLPKALLTQFIVTRQADIARNRTLVWRHGVVLEWKNEACAEVSKTKLEGRDAYHIRTQGNNRKGIMTIILKTFRGLHADYKGIKYKEKVPCMCEGCKNGKNKQHYFDFAYLQFRLEKGRYEVDCEKSLEPVNVMRLLENTFVFENFMEGRTLRLKEIVPRESVTEIRTLNLFLASSSELENEREKIEIAIRRKNESLRKIGFSINLLIWEDGKHISKSLRSQDNYNLEIEQCNLFSMLFYSKVGKYSLEEYKLAKLLFEKKQMPRICIFQKDKDLPKNLSRTDADSRYDFLERLREIEHFPILFQNTDMLINELGDTIDKLLRDETFTRQLKVE